jgi:glycosyltransferase involved in cell wall biosynthesis
MTQRTTPANTPRRRKIAIVAGKIRHPRALLMFEGLNAHYDVDIYAINHPDFNRSRELTSRIYLYEESPEMPGYLRGLEDRLVDADMVIGMETSCIATFQAIRAAARLGIPSGVVVNEFIPYFYSSFANIRAVQSDVLEKASFFWATSQLAAAALEVEGVAPERIARVELPVSTKRFRPSADSRAKFRDYIRLRAEERLVTFHGDLIPENQPERLLQATRVMRQMAPGRVPPLRLMFVGNGPHAESLKYQAHDMGLGSQILFLHQDPAPFLHDLYAATDAIIRPEVKRTDMHEDIPWAVLESMASGSAAIVVRSTITSELAGGGAIQADSSMHPHFSQALLGITASDEALARAKQAARQWIETRHHPDVAVGQIASDIERILAAPSSRDLRRAALESGMRSALEAIEENNPNDALVHVEDLLLLDPPAGQARGDILRVKGDALRALGKAEDAMDAYAKSL